MNREEIAELQMYISYNTDNKGFIKTGKFQALTIHGEIIEADLKGYEVQRLKLINTIAKHDEEVELSFVEAVYESIEDDTINIPKLIKIVDDKLNLPF